MTDDELRRLIAECDAAISDDGVNAKWAIQCIHLAPVVRDALRFRHITRNAEHLPDSEPGTRVQHWFWSVQWGTWCDRGTDLRAAIDADMEASR